MENIMLDLETLGNKSNSVISEIAAVEFDIQTGFTGREFYKKVDIQSCVDAGLKIDVSTVLWWMKQSEEARAPFQNIYSESIIDCLDSFDMFIGSNRLEVKIWGNSARFDCGILQNAYNALGRDIPWGFYNERDVRTLVDFLPKVKANMPFEGVKHNPIDDCKHQIKYCSEIYNQIKI